MKTKIEKLVFGGQGMGRVENRVAFIWGALPGEEIDFVVTKKKKNFMEGIATVVHNPSPHRVEEKDPHYLACSPWQTMDYSYENEWKKTIARETYSRIGGIETGEIDIVFPEKYYGYRNKIEYNFTTNKKGELSFAFHERGTHYLQAVENCALTSELISSAGEKIIKELRGQNVPLSALKSVIIRSDGERAAAALFVKDTEFCKKYLFDQSNLGLRGFDVYYSDPRSPASVPSELLKKNGNSELEIKLQEKKFQFGLLSFFQINPEIFEKTLADMKPHVEGRVVDFYSGVGAIGLSLHGKYTKAILVEDNKEATDFALRNIKNNNINNCSVINSPAEKSFPDVGSEDVVIVDPPRTGLHQDLKRYLHSEKPKRIIYLSCGIDTHARDIMDLAPSYKPIFWKLYNFFPRTPHIEALCVLEKI